MINVNDIPAVRAMVEQQAGARSSGNTAAPVQGDGLMVQAASLPAVRALLEQADAPVAPQYARAPVGNGYDAAIRQRRGNR